MPNTDPPRASLRQATRDAIAQATWNTTTKQLEKAGVVLKASLHQVVLADFRSTVEWLATTAVEYGDAVTVIIPQTTYDIIKNGTFDAQTGVVTHGGVSYIFEQKMSPTGVRSMLPRAPPWT